MGGQKVSKKSNAICRRFRFLWRAGLFHHNISSYPQTEEKLTSDLGI